MLLCVFFIIKFYNRMRIKVVDISANPHIMILSFIFTINLYLFRAYSSSKSIVMVAPATDNISKALFDEKDLECLAKDETIQVCRIL